MAKIKEGNHFTCLLANSEKCARGLLGQLMCDGCEHDMKCDCCGKKNTIFCIHCDVSLAMAATIREMSTSKDVTENK